MSIIEPRLFYKPFEYQTPATPFIVSELRGNTVYRLFRFVLISDGNSANQLVKISIANMSFNNMTFDIIVRDFYDTDANPIVLEKFTNCTMDPGSNSFVAKKMISYFVNYWEGKLKVEVLRHYLKYLNILFNHKKSSILNYE